MEQWRAHKRESALLGSVKPCFMDAGATGRFSACRGSVVLSHTNGDPQVLIRIPTWPFPVGSG